MKETINETTKLKESIDKQNENSQENSNQSQETSQNTSNEDSSKLYNDPQYRALLNHFGGQIPRLRPELRELKEQVLHFGSDIVDDEDPKKYADRPYLEQLGHKLYKLYEFIEHYLHAFLSVGVAIFIIYKTNLFFNLYFNEKIKKYYLYSSAFLFIIDIITFMYIYIYLPYIKKYDENKVEKEFDEVVPYCTFIGVFALICLIISMWNVYGILSVPIVLTIFWGIVMSSNIVQNGILGNLFFICLITAMLFSHKFIEGKGWTYYK
jgi:hypothetical protein